MEGADGKMYDEADLDYMIETELSDYEYAEVKKLQQLLLKADV